ncbi:MAG: ATP-binding protein [Oscillospiraceae bacterium]|jgi:predicted AAA+ superfamily ATPase|nr:ATP-binding protein [Oscillospiraceae bacterium]
MYIKRKLEKKILNLSAAFPVVMVTGARQVGKTTLLKHLAESARNFVTLDIPENRIMAVEEPAAFFQKYKPPLIIDEFQYAPNLLPYIKAYVDEHKICGCFWLTGSQSFVSMQNVSESLAGRVGIVNLFSLSNSEISGSLFDNYETSFDTLLARFNKTQKVSRRELFEKMVKGGMPRLYERADIRTDDYFGSYFQTYLSRDIKDLSQVADELSFYKFMRVCAGLTASHVDYTNISKKVGITVNKAKEWVSILVSSGIIILLSPYFSNSLKRVIKTPKLYFMDMGLLCYLYGIDDADVLEKLSNSGAFFENYVISEVYKSFVNTGLRPSLYYYRDTNNRKEIDLLIERNGVLYPIEIKESANPGKNAIKNFDAIAPVTNTGMTIGTGNIICSSNDIYPIGNDTWAVPHWLI